MKLDGVNLARVRLPRLTIRQSWGEIGLGPATLSELNAGAVLAQIEPSGELIGLRGEALAAQAVVINSPSVALPGQLHLHTGELQATQLTCGNVDSDAETLGAFDVAARKIVAPKIALTAAGQRLEASVRASGARADFNKDPQTLVANLAGTTIEEALWSFVGGELGVAELLASGVNLQLDIPATIAQLAAALSSAEADTIRLSFGEIELTIEQLRAPEGLSYSSGELSVPVLEASGVSLSLDLASLLASQSNADEPSRRWLTDASLAGLDQLTGGVTLDARVDATYPVLGRRSALHPIRLSVDAGVIDYRQLERSLARLENAALDFELAGDRLILEKDLPLVPFDNVTLVSWPLDAAAIALAQSGRVALRTLLGAELAEATATVAQLHSLSSSLELLLGVADSPATFLLPNDGATATLQLSKGTTLRVVGAVSYDANSTGAFEPELLKLEIEHLAGELRDLKLGSMQLSVAVGGSETIHGTLSVQNLAPKGIALGCEKLRLTDLRLTFLPG